LRPGQEAEGLAAGAEGGRQQAGKRYCLDSCQRMMHLRWAVIWLENHVGSMFFQRLSRATRMLFLCAGPTMKAAQ
jgi:hypothetical protein